MIGKLPKFEAWKQSDPDRLGLLLHPRYLSRDSIGIHRIPIELPHMRYEEGSQQAGAPQSLVTLLIKLHLATTLRMGALQVESPKCGVCSDFHW
jgi:hypothetical protein